MPEGQNCFTSAKLISAYIGGHQAFVKMRSNGISQGNGGTNPVLKLASKINKEREFKISLKINFETRKYTIHYNREQIGDEYNLQSTFTDDMAREGFGIHVASTIDNKGALYVDNIRAYSGTDFIDIGNDRMNSHIYNFSDVSVNSSGIYERPEAEYIMNEVLGSARPRVIINRARVNEIKNSKDTKISEMKKTVFEKANAYLSSESYSYTCNNNSLEDMDNAMSLMLNLGMAYLLTDDKDDAKKYAQRAYKEAEVLFDVKGSKKTPDGGDDYWNSYTWLDVSEISAIMAVCYDWMYDGLTPSQRAELEKHTLEKGILRSYKGIYSEYDPKSINPTTFKYTNNWGAVCNGSILMASIAFMEADPYMCSQMAEANIRAIEHMLPSFAPNGAWSEGVGYWGYTLKNLSYMCSTLDSVFGNDFGITKAQGLKETQFFSIASEGKVSTAGFGDSGVDRANTPYLFYWAKKFNDKEIGGLAKYIKEEFGYSYNVYDLLYYDGAYINTQNYEKPHFFYFSGDLTELVTMENNASSDGIFVAMTGGKGTASNHDHIDSGSIIVDIGGERLMRDAGAEHYQAPQVFDDNRYFYYKNRPEGHNIFVINPHNLTNGVVEANENTSLTNADKSCGDDTIMIDDVSFYAPGFENYIGKNVRIFYGNDSKNTVIIGYENLNKIYTYTNEDYLKIAGTTLTVTPADANKDVRYNLEGDYSVIYNGKFYGSADYNSVINPAAGSVSLIDNDDNSSIDVIVIKSVEYGIVGSVNEFDEKIYDKYKRNGLVDLTNGGNGKYFASEADGTAIELHDLEAGDIIGYAISKDGKLTEVIHYTERVGGTLDSKSSDGKIEVKGKEYPLSSYYTTNVKSLNNIKFGSQIILHLGVGDQVIYVEEFVSGMQYGVFVATAQTSGISGENIVLIYGTDGVMHQYSVSKKLKFNGTLLPEASISSKLEDTENLELVLRVIKYSLDSEGKVNKIFTAKDNENGAAQILIPVTDEARPVLYSRNLEEDQGNASLAGKLFGGSSYLLPLYHLSSSTSIVQVPISNDYRTNEEYYAAYSPSAFGTAVDGSENQHYYGYDNHNGIPAFVLWTKDGAGATEVGEVASAIIESVTQGLNEEGEAVKVFKAYRNKEWIKLYSKANYSETETDLKNTVNAFQPGDIVQVALDNKNTITAAKINFSYIGDDVNGSKYTDSENKNNLYSPKEVGFETGYILTVADKRAMLVRNKTLDDALAGNYGIINTVATPLNKGTVVFVKFNRSKQNPNNIIDAVVYTESDVNVAESIYNSGRNADYLVQRSRFGAIALTVIYTN